MCTERQEHIPCVHKLALLFCAGMAGLLFPGFELATPAVSANPGGRPTTTISRGTNPPPSRCLEKKFDRARILLNCIRSCFELIPLREIARSSSTAAAAASRATRSRPAPFSPLRPFALCFTFDFYFYIILLPSVSGERKMLCRGVRRKEESRMPGCQTGSSLATITNGWQLLLFLFQAGIQAAIQQSSHPQPKQTLERFPSVFRSAPRPLLLS